MAVFEVNLGQSVPSWSYSYASAGRKILAISGRCFLIAKMLLLSPSQQCQSIEGNKSAAFHWGKSPTGLILFHPNPYHVNVTILALTGISDIDVVMAYTDITMGSTNLSIELQSNKCRHQILDLYFWWTCQKYVYQFINTSQQISKYNVRICYAGRP